MTIFFVCRLQVPAVVMRFARAEEELHEKNPQTEPLTRGAKLVRDLERERESEYILLVFPDVGSCCTKSNK